MELLLAFVVRCIGKEVPYLGGNVNGKETYKNELLLGKTSITSRT